MLFLAASWPILSGDQVRFNSKTVTDFSWVFLAICAASALWSINGQYTLFRTASLVLLFLASFRFFWLWADRLSEERLVKQLLYTLGIALSFNLFASLLIAPGELLATRYRGFFQNPNNIGLMVALATPLSFQRMLQTQHLWDRLLWFSFVLNIFACGSRTAMVSAVIGMALILVAQMSRKPALVVVLSTVGIVGFILALETSIVQERLVRNSTLENLSNRTFFWDLAKEKYIPARPWLGHGFGSDGNIHSHYGIDLKDLKLRGYGVMSSYYGFAVTLGIPFTILFFSILWLGTLRSYRRYRLDPRLVAYSSTVFAGLVTCIAESAIYSAGNCFAFLFWIIVMLMVRRSLYLKYQIPMTASGALDLARLRPKPSPPKIPNLQPEPTA